MTDTQKDTFSARELINRLEGAFGDDWSLTVHAGGSGELATPDGKHFFSFASELDGIIDGKLKQSA